MANCSDIFQGKQCWGTADQAHAMHWAGDLEWPNEAFRPIPPRVENPRMRMLELVDRIRGARTHP